MSVTVNLAGIAPAKPIRIEVDADEFPEGWKKFDPNQLRDPHTGRWVDVPGTGAISDADVTDAVSGWVSGWAAIANSVLRGFPTPTFAHTGKPPSDAEVDHFIASMDAAFERSGHEHHGHLFRGLDLAEVSPEARAAVHNNGTFSDAGFLSTSGSRQVARNFAESEVHPRDPVEFEITVPPGTRTVSTGARNEAEEVLPRGGTLKVTSTHPDTRYGHTVTVAEAEWHPA